MAIPAVVTGLLKEAGKGFLIAKAGEMIGGKEEMAGNVGGFDIMRAIAELIPGTQTGMGETQGAEGPLASLGNMFGALIPGIQTGLGEGVPGLPAGSIAKSWNTGTAQFYLLIDGRIAVQRKNGTWKIYRPQKHIVVPRNPRIGTLIRADKRIDNLMRGVQRRLPANRRRTTRSRVNITEGDARALRGLLTAGGK